MAMKISNFFKHLHTVNKHRFLVCKLCFKMGLYWQGLTHDLSKYSPTEFLPGVKYFQGTRSPIGAERKDLGYSAAWLHHKGHNRHHWEYWVDHWDAGIYVNEIPKKYLKEMVCDRIAASMVYQKDKYHPSSALEFWQNGMDKDVFPPKSAQILVHYLTIVANNPLDQAIKIIRDED